MKNKQIIWSVLGLSAITLLAGTEANSNILSSIISGCLLGIWLLWTSNLIKWKK